MSAASQPSIVLVEDDPRLAELISRYLGNHGFNMTVVSRGDEAVGRVRRDEPDLVILDLGLPGEDGFAICKRLRPGFTNPILILTARDNDIDHVVGLELGADDYVIKPVEPRVLLARIAVLLRRSRPPATPGTGRTIICGSLRISVASRAVQWRECSIALSRNEFDLLVHLASHPGEIQSREKLFKSLYNRDYDGLDRMLDIRVSRLRRKLGDDAENPQRIKTIWGRGYLFVPDAW